jgi:putative oxidoreductase
MNNVVYRIGTIVFAIVVGFFGVSHILNATSMAAMVPSYLPSPIVWVYISGAALLLAAIAIIINVQSKLAGYLLVVLLAIIIATIHLPGLKNNTNTASKMDSMINILKDLAMIAGALMVAAKGK